MKIRIDHARFSFLRANARFMIKMGGEGGKEGRKEEAGTSDPRRRFDPRCRDATSILITRN